MMTKENRVLAYEKAVEIKDSELFAVSGGSAKFTVSNVTRGTGYPVVNDIEITQVYD